MSLAYGGSQPKSIKYSNAEVKSIIYGGKTVWQKITTVTLTPKFHPVKVGNSTNYSSDTFTIPEGINKVTKITGIPGTDAMPGGYITSVEPGQKLTCEIAMPEAYFYIYVFDSKGRGHQLGRWYTLDQNKDYLPIGTNQKQISITFGA